MGRLGLRSRAITHTYAAVVAVGAAFCATLMVMTSEGIVEMIGPGYARMQPIDKGKAEKVTYSVPYSIPVKSHAPKVQPVRVIAEPVVAQLAPALVIAATQPLYNRDIHRVY